MDISRRRGEFNVFVIDRVPASAKALNDSLQAMGYSSTRFYPTVESALTMARQEPPHIVVIDFASIAAPNETPDAVLESIRDLSSEILVILVVPTPQILLSLQLVSRDLAYDTIIKPFVTNLELLQKVDRAAGRLYFQFESEQLREHYESKQGEGTRSGHTPLAVPFQVVPSGEVSRPGHSDVNEMLSILSEEKDIEESTILFMEAVTRALYDVPVLYFRYFSSHMSLLFSKATLLPNEKFRGIGVDLRKEDAKRIPEYFADPRKIPELSALIREVFKREAFAAFPHYDEGEPRGVFVVLDDAEVNAADSKIRTLRGIFDLAYKRNVTIKEKHTLDVSDGQTGLFNKKHFTKLLSDEIARARRLTLPVSLLVFEVDNVAKLHEKIGFHAADAVLRSIGLLLKKSARVNDILARVAPDQFACLMPHTAHMGGAVKAERFRRSVESAMFPGAENFGPVTISCGVSEYPSFVSDAETLFYSADDAFREVRRSGGNKVCLAKAPAGFKLDFKPEQVPSAARGLGRAR